MRASAVRAWLAVGATALVVMLATAGGEARGDDLTSACVYASVKVLNGSPTTVKVDSSGSACPGLPPSPSNPCPGGDGYYERRTVTSLGAEYIVLVCVKDLP
jgi:hypothetical protein